MRNRRQQRPLSEARTISNLNRVAGSAINTQPPTTGIHSSADSLNIELDRLHVATIVFMENGSRKIGEQFHLQTSDVLNFLWARLRVKT